MNPIDELERLVNVLKGLQEMAGGRKRSQAVFWAIFIPVALILFAVAYTRLSDVATDIHDKPVLANICWAFIGSLLSLLFLIGISTAIGMLIGMIINFAFATKTTLRIDNAFSSLRPLLEKSANEFPNSEAIKKLHEEIEQAYLRWNSSRITRFVRWFYKKPKAKEIKT